MSITQSMANALSGLNAASRAAEIVSANVANATTEGYGRRSLELAADDIGGVGAGVRVVGVRREVDTAILADRRLADADLAGAETRSGALSRIEGLAGQPGSGGSLSDRIAALETALTDAAGDPSSTLRLSSVVSALDGVVSEFHRLDDGLQQIRLDAEKSVAGEVDQLNTTLSKLEGLNADIVRVRTSGGDSSALEDQRQILIDQVNQIVPVRELPRENGRVALMSTSGALLLDGPPAEFSFSPVATMTADLSVTTGTLGQVQMNGRAQDFAGGSSLLRGGSLEAAFDLRDATIPALQQSLDRTAADLADRLSGAAATPPDPAGTHDILLDGGDAVDPVDITGLSGRLTLNSALATDPTLLRDGLGAAGPVAEGDGRALNDLIDALSEPRTRADGGVGTAYDAATAFQSAVATQRLDAETDMTIAGSSAALFKEAELAGGVDTDAEMQRLLLIEQAYAANARVIQTIDQLIQTLIEL
ncbi:flagellar hook-associated protein FlgK [Aestuariibius sp. 2305UL40-4]|uniref:flagellar hook-associated protein FlgK n=1 Tax=Aestuariibius violaceus TaxID=3234132 RepID=UPI00345EBE91